MTAASIRITQAVEYFSNRPRIAFTIGAAMMAIQISPFWYATPDAAVYLSIARSIARGGPITALGNPHLALPIGYPIMVAPAFLISGYPFLYISLIHWLLTLILMAGVFRWASQFGPTAALLIAALVMANASLWIYYHRTLSELAFMTVSVWAVSFLNAGISANRQTQQTISQLALGSVLLALAASVRESGVVFAVGLAAAATLAAARATISFRRAALRTVVAASPTILAVAAFVIFDTHRIRHSPIALGTHIAGFTDSARSLLFRLNEGGRLRLSEIGRLLVPGMFKAYGRAGQWFNLNVIVFIPVALLVAFGWFRLMRRHCDILAATLPLYCGLYVLWAFDADTRYMLPMLPVLVASLWFALERMGRARVVALGALFLLHLGVAAGYWLTVEMPRARACNDYWPTIIRMATSISGEQGSVEASASECPRLLMEFALDRAVDPVHDSALVPANARWLLTKDHGTLPANYESVLSGAGLELSAKH